MTPLIDLLRRSLAGREEHAALCSIKSAPLKYSVKFSWVDYFARQSGLLIVAPEAESQATAGLLLEALSEWRSAAEPRAKAKGAAA